MAASPFNPEQLQYLSTMETDVAELKKDVAELKTDVAELKKDVAELKKDMKEIRGLYFTAWTPDASCPICLDSMEPGYHSRTRCGHIFHKECILHHYNNFSTLCPMCRCQSHPIRRHTLEDRSGEVDHHRA